ncbi:MAG: hypothetical protein AB8B61_01470 [Cyclobacteriaceae bacterium]
MSRPGSYTIFHIKLLPKELLFLNRLYASFEKMMNTSSGLENITWTKKQTKSLIILKVYSPDPTFFNGRFRHPIFYKFLYLMEKYLTITPYVIVNTNKGSNHNRELLEYIDSTTLEKVLASHT